MKKIGRLPSNLKVSFEIFAGDMTRPDIRAENLSDVVLHVDASSCEHEMDAVYTTSVLMSVMGLNEDFTQKVKLTYESATIDFRDGPGASMMGQASALQRAHIAVKDQPHFDDTTQTQVDLMVTENARDMTHVARDALRFAKDPSRRGSPLSFAYNGIVGMAHAREEVVTTPEGVVLHMTERPMVKMTVDTGSQQRARLAGKPG